MSITPLDLLFIILAFCALILTIFIVVLITNLSRILKNASSIVERVDDLTFSLNNYIKMPLQAINSVVERVKNSQRKKKDKNDEE